MDAPGFSGAHPSRPLPAIGKSLRSSRCATVNARPQGRSRRVGPPSERAADQPILQTQRGELAPVNEQHVVIFCQSFGLWCKVARQADEDHHRASRRLRILPNRNQLLDADMIILIHACLVSGLHSSFRRFHRVFLQIKNFIHRGSRWDQAAKKTARKGRLQIQSPLV